MLDQLQSEEAKKKIKKTTKTISKEIRDLIRELDHENLLFGRLEERSILRSIINEVREESSKLINSKFIS